MSEHVESEKGPGIRLPRFREGSLVFVWEMSAVEGVESGPVNRWTEKKQKLYESGDWVALHYSTVQGPYVVGRVIQPTPQDLPKYELFGFDCDGARFERLEPVSCTHVVSLGDGLEKLGDAFTNLAELVKQQASPTDVDQAAEPQRLAS